MRKRPYCRNRRCGCLAVAGGVLILFGLILPSGFWWMLCAAALIFGGLMLMRS